MTNDEAHAYLLALENAQPPDQRSAANLGEAIRAIRAHAIVDFKSMIHEGVMAELLEIRAGTQILSDAYFADGQETRMSGAINRIDAAADHIVDQIRLR